MNPVRYLVAEDVPAKAWSIQGTVYTNLLDAKMAALKLFASLLNDGVYVKQIGAGYMCFYWRRK